MPISDELLSILVCPQCKQDLQYDRTAEKLICAACGLRYPIVDDIPVMLVEEAERIDKH
jgi:LSD1 subclass zinc finger protein